MFRHFPSLYMRLYYGTKWYSDFGGCLLVLLKAVLIKLCNRAHLQKGFWGTVFLWAIPYIILALFGTMLIPFLLIMNLLV